MNSHSSHNFPCHPHKPPDQPIAAPGHPPLREEKFIRIRIKCGEISPSRSCTGGKVKDQMDDCPCRPMTFALRTDDKAHRRFKSAPAPKSAINAALHRLCPGPAVRPPSCRAPTREKTAAIGPRHLGTHPGATRTWVASQYGRRLGHSTRDKPLGDLGIGLGCRPLPQRHRSSRIPGQPGFKINGQGPQQWQT